MSQASPQFRIGQIARKLGLHIETIRYYERKRLVRSRTRTSSGYRLYGTEELCRLRFIKNAQALGFTLREVSELLNLRVSTSGRCGDVQARAEAKLAHVQAKIQDLHSLARALRGLIKTCRAGKPTDRCPILDGWEEEAAEGMVKRRGKGRAMGPYEP